MAKFTIHEVLDRQELPLSKKIDVKYLVIESIDQYWEGGKCFIAVRYKQVPYKRRWNIKNRNCDHDA